MAAGESELKSFLLGMVQFVRRQIINQPVAPIISEPEFFRMRIPINPTVGFSSISHPDCLFLIATGKVRKQVICSATSKLLPLVCGVLN